MKIVVNKQILTDTLNIVSKAVPSKSPMPVLECILVDASTEKIKLIANDTEIGIESTVEGDIEEHGIIAIDADIFSNIVRRLPDGMVLIATDGEKVHIACGKAKFDIMGRDGSDFVYLPEVEQEYGIEISELTLKDVITRTIFAVPATSTNPVMTGELFEVHGDRMRVIGLDGHRIAMREVELRKSFNDSEVIIPAKTLQEVVKILGNDPERVVSIYFNKNHILFRFEETLVVSRIIDGKYYNVDAMVSMDYHTVVKINKQEFLSCIDRAILLVKEDDKKPLLMNIRDGEIECRIRTTLGKMDETIFCEKEMNDLKICFNPRFLMDSVRVIEDEEIILYLNTQKSPAYIRSEGKYCYFVLPVNFQDYE